MAHQDCRRNINGDRRFGMRSRYVPVGRRFALLLMFAVVLTAGLYSHQALANMPTESLTLLTAKGRFKLTVEVAETEAQKSLGLMFRNDVPRGTGMIFPYATPREITMWMRNTYVSLDMVFIRADGVVHRIAFATEPMSDAVVASQGKVVAVLELAAGEAAYYGLKPGDRVGFRTFPPLKPPGKTQ